LKTSVADATKGRKTAAKTPPARLTAATSPKPSASPLSLKDDAVKEMTDTFSLLADPSRLKILLALARDGELHVSALCKMLGQSQPAVSHHLTLLRFGKLVNYRRDGKFNFYRVDSSKLGDLLTEVFSATGDGQKFSFGDVHLSFKKK
jgi:ArsR family transcriptional regulator